MTRSVYYRERGKTRFQDALIREGLTQADLHRALGISRASVGEFVRGERDWPPRRRAQVLIHFEGRLRAEDFKEGT